MNEPVTTTPAPKRRGRPPKAKTEVKAAPTQPKPRYKMKAKPNWEDVEDIAFEDAPDRLRIAKELIPEGMDLQWVTDSVFGQAFPQRRAEFEKRGWTPVHQEDFDGQFDGMFMPKGTQGEIKVEGVVLMARPLELSRKAKILDRRKANEQVQIKEASLRGGELPGVTLDSQHPNAVNSNRINKSYERIPIPED